MLIVNVEEAHAGMTLAAPVAHPENPQHDLLKRGYSLEDAMLPRLKGLGIETLYVDYPGLDDLDRHLAPLLSPARQTMYRQVRETMTLVQNRMHARVSFVDYYATTREMVTTLLNQGSHPVFMDAVGALGPDAVAHAATVAHLALVMGLRLEAYLIQQRSRLTPAHAREVVNLGVAGMLHDVGKMHLPESLRGRCELDAPSEADARGLWESHARVGFEMVRGGVESSAAAAVLHHHQHFDGSGFPAPQVAVPPGKRAERDTSPPRGDAVHIFARILFVADLYANLAQPAGAKRRRGNLEVLHLMRTRYGKWIDPVVFRTLQAVAPPFLPGSKVVLGDRSTAAVVEVRPTDPYAPVVRRFKPGGAELDGPALDLRDSSVPRLVALPSGQPIAAFMPTPHSATSTAAEAFATA